MLRLFFILICQVISFSLVTLYLKPIFSTKTLLFPYTLKPFDICIEFPTFWKHLKNIYLLFLFLSTTIISNFLYSTLFKKTTLYKKKIINNKENSFNLKIGRTSTKKEILINEQGSYQNFLITGGIGSGKTSSAIIPLCDQIISSKKPKIGMLILDVKGNLYKNVENICYKYNRDSDLIKIELNGAVKYNPLHKPHLKASVLANRLKVILTLFSTNNSDSYWLDKAEQTLCECIKLCRLYNNNYVTFDEIHKLVSYPDYINQKMPILQQKFRENKLSKEDSFNLLSALNFFNNDFFSIDSKVLSIIKSEITRITNIFISDQDVYNTFCANINNLTFKNFNYIIEKSKIVILNMNIAKYQSLSKIIAAYLKLDFQTEVLSSLSNCSSKTCAFICDEYHEYVTTTDAEFFAQSREAKCINIVATQSYTSLLNSLKDEYATKVIIQNLINKLWFKTTDSFTIEEIQKQLGKEDKIKTSKGFTKNGISRNLNLLSNSLLTTNNSFSETINSYIQNEYIFDTNFFTKELDTFNCLAFLSNGISTFCFEKLYMCPYFKITTTGHK